MEQNSNIKVEKRNRSIFFPLLIVFIGIYLLLSNLNMIPGGGWNLLVRFWPVIFILGSIDDLLNQKWVGAVINFSLGFILVLANFGFFSMSSWQIIINYWPVLIIALGLEIILRGRSVVTSLIGIAFAGLLVFGLVSFAIKGPLTKDANSHLIEYGKQGITNVELTIKPLVGNLVIKSGESTNQLVTGEIQVSGDEHLVKESEILNGEQKITLASSGNVMLPSRNVQNGYPWYLALNSEIPFSLTIEQIIGIQKLLLSELNIDALDAMLVIGTMEVVLPEEEFLAANLECIIGEMVIRIPEGMEVRIELDSGMTGVSLDDGFIKEGNLIYSTGAKTKDVTVLKVNLPMGSLKVLSQP
ncbi:MAG: DUF5668 domain-containing protein [Anaerolineaceae bacterium]|nr:DUF5668 domain-containing protein [Anaerolineaceae bacterium]